MKLAINQPYFFPYIGYFILIATVNQFCLLDNVMMKKRSWITRNYFGFPDSERISIPVENISQNRLISEHRIFNLDEFHQTFLKKLENTYRDYPYYEENRYLLIDAISKNRQNLSDFLLQSIQSLCKTLEINTEIVALSNENFSALGKKENLILSICKIKKADVYVNLPNGLSLYDPDTFQKEGIKLEFLPDFSKIIDCNREIYFSSIITQLMYFGRKKTIKKIDDCLNSWQKVNFKET